MTDPTRSDAVRGRLTDAGLSIEFGLTEQSEAGGDKRIQLSDRVALTPAAARRLAISLDEALATGRFEAPAPGDAAADRVTPRGRTPVHAPATSQVELSARLMNAVSGLDIPYQHERSVRLKRGAMEGNRYLLTCNLADLGSDPFHQVMAVVDPLDFPVSLRGRVRALLDGAACVHFGFEDSAQGALCKLYLECALDFQALRAGPSDPVLLHHAFKWRPQSEDRGFVETRYLWHPNLDAAALAERMDAVLARAEAQGIAALVRSALAVALGKVKAQQLGYLEVTEGDNPRDSFDLNLYEAGMQVKDLQQALFALREQFEIPPGRFQALYDQIRGRQLGHIAAGTHRDGGAFVTVYYGLAGFPRFNANLG